MANVLYLGWGWTEDIIFSSFNNDLGQTAYYCRSTEGFKRYFSLILLFVIVAPLADAVRIATPAVIPAAAAPLRLACALLRILQRSGLGHNGELYYVVKSPAPS